METTMNQTDDMRDFYISEYEKFLENNGIDTVCFMGYGYKFEDVKVGAEFYFSYLYHGRMSALRNSTPDEVLRSVLLHTKSNEPNIDFTDRYKIIQKYKYYNCKTIDFENKKLLDVKERREFVKIKNLRTGKITILGENDIDCFDLFLFTFW